MEKNHTPAMTGHLDVFVGYDEEDEDGNPVKRFEVLIHGDPEGLRSLAAVLLELANKDQNEDVTLPVGAREHFHLDPRRELSLSSCPVIIGRLDAKGTGAFYDRFVPRKK
jgi:hypothetical protein